MPVTSPVKVTDKGDESTLEQASAKRIKLSLEVLGTQIDAIANGFLGLPIKGDLFEAIFKFIADNRDEERSLKEKKLLSHAHEFLKTIKRQFEPQPDPNFKLVDDHTRFFHFLLTQQTKNGQEVTASDICLPKPKRDDFNFAPVPGVQGLMCTREDEDQSNLKNFKEEVEVTNTFFEIVIALFDLLEYNEKPVYFESKNQKDAIASLFEKHFSEGRVPEPLEHFDDFEKDDTISNMAFYGIGQNFLKKATGKEGKIAYEVDCTTVLSGLETRSGYERYGANAFFGEDRKLMEIHVSSMGKTIKPKDKEWMHAKWVWRVSLVTLVTAGNHLMKTHWTVANTAHIAARTKLNEDHPIRQVMKVFTYGTGAINNVANTLLMQDKGLFHRMFGFTYKGFSSMLSSLYEDFKYETLPEMVASKKLSKEMEEQIPLCTDGLPVWNAFLKFFESYVDFFYPDESNITTDVDLRRFWLNVDLKGEFNARKPYGLPQLSKKALVEYLTHLAFTVTAGHEFNGTIVHYLLSPKAGAFKLRPEKDEADIQAFVQHQILIGLTGAPRPKLMEDWSHLLPNKSEVKTMYTKLTGDLKEVSAKVDKANETVPCPGRPKICQSFNPKHFETSVSI